MATEITRRSRNNNLGLRCAELAEDAKKICREKDGWDFIPDGVRFHFRALDVDGATIKVDPATREVGYHSCSSVAGVLVKDYAHKLAEQFNKTSEEERYLVVNDMAR